MSGRVITVGICTFRRPGLLATLESVESQAMPEGAALSIIVADNDETPGAEAMLRDFAARSCHQVTYVHAPARNISIARNAILDAARARGAACLAFIDDDEVAPPDWLLRLDAAMRGSGADAVLGPVRAEYGAEAPAWMRAARVHDTRPETGRDGRPIAGHSCNVLIDLSRPAFAGLRFDQALGRIGGEDTAWFEAARRAGARLALAEDATVTEAVPEARARLGWLLRRRYRMGQTHASLHGSQTPMLAGMALALAKIGWCAGAALTMLPSAKYRNLSILRGALHVGVLSVILGRRRISIYGEDDAARTGQARSAATVSRGEALR